MQLRPCHSFVRFHYVGYSLVNNKIDKVLRMRMDIFRYQVYVAPCVIDKFEGLCNFLDFRYTSRYQVHIVLHVLSKLKGIYSLLGLRYISGSKVHVAPHVLGELKGTFNCLVFRYTSESEIRVVSFIYKRCL